jgi:alkylhydroperoxidase family enzyme
VQKILDDPGLNDLGTAPISAGLRATLLFLRKMTATPSALTPEDARAVLATGVSREALLQAIHVAYLFNIYDRLADTLGWDIPKDPGAYAAVAKNLLSSRGYTM